MGAPMIDTALVYGLPPRVRHMQRLVLLRLAFQADDAGRASEKIADMAQACCCNPGTIKRALKALCDLRLVVKSKGEGGAIVYSLQEYRMRALCAERPA